METYGSFRPTQFDSHIELDRREHWLVLPVSRHRDSGCLDESNFHCALEALGGESRSVEVHRFGHWGHGWFEIILVSPTNKKLVAIAEDIERGLMDYPVLDDEDLSRRESEDADESWDNYGAREFQKALLDALNCRLDEYSDTLPSDPHQRWCKNWGMDVDLCQCGDCIETESEWIGGVIDTVDNMSNETLYEMGKNHFGLESEYHGDGTYFRWNKNLDVQMICDMVAAYEKKQVQP